MKREEALWIVVLILMALGFLFPKTRWFKLSAIGVAILAVAALVVIIVHGQAITPELPAPPTAEKKPIDLERFHVERLDKSDPEAKSRLALTDVRFDQVRPEEGAERGTLTSVVARLYNDSPTYTLTDFGYHLVIQDCVQAACAIVLDQTGLSGAVVPPSQARDVKIAIRDGGVSGTPPIKLLGAAKVALAPTETRAQP